MNAVVDVIAGMLQNQIVLFEPSQPSSYCLTANIGIFFTQKYFHLFVGNFSESVIAEEVYDKIFQSFKFADCRKAKLCNAEDLERIFYVDNRNLQITAPSVFCVGNTVVL